MRQVQQIGHGMGLAELRSKAASLCSIETTIPSSRPALGQSTARSGSQGCRRQGGGQAVLQRLQPQWDPTFSEHSYGFRPGRSAHQAVAQAQAHVIDGYQFVVDLDLAKFFDRVNHDRLMAAVAARVSDRRVLRLFRGYLTAGVLDGGLFEESREGRRKAVRSRPCSRTSSWMNWIASSIVAATDLCGTRMTVTSTSAAKRPAGGSWRA